MKLPEYRGKSLFSIHNITIPKGDTVELIDDLENIKIKLPWVLKAQVLVGGRGKAGGIKFAETLDDAKDAYNELINMKIKGEKVRRILIEEKLEIEREFYLSFFLDRTKKEYLMMFADQGGINIETISDIIKKVHINPIIGIQEYHLRKIPKEIRLVAKKLYKMFIELDCELVEINPLVLVSGKPVAADSKVILDNNALYRHTDILLDDEELTDLEQEARDKNISFIQLDGSIGVIANGAGLTMATLDALNEFNAKGGVFLDLGGTDNPKKVKEAFELISKAKQNVIFLNLFGGITKCDTVAEGIIEFLEEKNIDIPVVARIKGMNEKKACNMLEKYVVTVESFEDAAKKASELGG